MAEPAPPPVDDEDIRKCADCGDDSQDGLMDCEFCGKTTCDTHTLLCGKDSCMAHFCSASCGGTAVVVGGKENSWRCRDCYEDDHCVTCAAPAPAPAPAPEPAFVREPCCRCGEPGAILECVGCKGKTWYCRGCWEDGADDCPTCKAPAPAIGGAGTGTVAAPAAAPVEATTDEEPDELPQPADAAYFVEAKYNVYSRFELPEGVTLYSHEKNLKMTKKHGKGRPFTWWVSHDTLFWYDKDGEEHEEENTRENIGEDLQEPIAVELYEV